MKEGDNRAEDECCRSKGDALDNQEFIWFV